MSLRHTATTSASSTPRAAPSSRAAGTRTGDNEEEDDEEPVIAGPFVLHHGSFILEFLRPKPSRHASVLMRATYKHDHPLCRKGKAYPQAPPLHLHFQQSESLAVLSGELGTTTTYSRIDTIHTPQTTPPARPHHIAPYMPHQIWPSPSAKEDTTMLIWAHPNPKDMDDKMDRLFFQTLLLYRRHISATALVVLPGLTFLGPLRWWIPWLFQCLCAYLALWLGRKPLLKKYMSAEDWEDEDVQERIGMWRKKDL
ncbi:hypothetical protein Z517_02621 [Fonsecaea pedrosoi CBS 271.37]|uniref:Uncharacterized protein n=1 Tax=Fonsecaea pedrosoi CBS 271.37 TaxID=1442368 RepID=A0A0D2E027_9EURO|nr:uncharacterized protein Z517_02621 [Fonsecaea pedrosoi CBS 271.37]KIW83376.1 hypothetical protein Z517_02621 [Fonsecaea pedrosoi CBS 271.37]